MYHLGIGGINKQTNKHSDTVQYRLQGPMTFSNFYFFKRFSGNAVLSLGSFSCRLLSHVHGVSYKRALPVSTRLKPIYGYQQYRRVGTKLRFDVFILWIIVQV